MMEERIYIFGAHSRAQTLAAYLRYLYPDTMVEGYLYDNDEVNPEMVGGVPVIKLGRAAGLHTDYPVYIGTRGMYHLEISKSLAGVGFRKIVPVTAELDLQLRNAYLEKYFPSVGREFLKIDHLGKTRVGMNIAVYVAVSAFDKPLQQEYRLAAYEKAIQAGAALTDKRLWEGILTDDTGDNISGRNRQFCELTALYWIWKHAEEEIVGLVHYRRHFLLPKDWILRMEENHVDVILPVPLYVSPSLAGNFKSRHDPSDWEYMMEFLRARDREEYQEAGAFFEKNLYSPCNMFIMHKGVLDELCEWLFPILFAVAEHGGQKEDSYLNRYPGFLSERLITFFFERNRNRYKVAYSDKNFLA